MAGPEGERLPARAREHDRAAAEPRDRDARHRPGVGPGPRLDGWPVASVCGEGAFEQDLREQRLGVDPDRLTDKNAAADHQHDGERDR